MTWCSLPSRREISIILFSLTIFLLFYNLDTSFQQLRAVKHFAINGDAEPAGGKGVGAVGSVNWEHELYGDWESEELQVAKQSQEKKEEMAKASTSLWGPKVRGLLTQHPEIYGKVGVNDGYVNWGDALPTTTVVKHVPGYTILDHVFFFNNTVYIVTNDRSFPPLDSITSSAENSAGSSEWKMLTSEEGQEALGTYGGLIHGVTWLCTDAHPSNYTLFSLWRTYSSLNTSLLSSDPLVLPPPRRIFYSNVPTLMGEKPESIAPIVPRQRSPAGFHPYLPKAAFPTLGLMFKEDWQDFASMPAPFLMRRIVIADSGAASRSRDDVPPFALPLLQLDASVHWWEPIRRNVATFLGVEYEAKKNWIGSQKTVITYLSRQDAPGGSKLRPSDHDELVDAIHKLGNNYIVNVIPASAPWKDRMSAILQSMIVVGVSGNHLADSVFMAPSTRSTLIEILPPGVLARDVEVSLKSLGIKHFAWWNDKPYDGKSDPPDILPAGSDTSEISIDIDALMKAIRKI